MKKGMIFLMVFSLQIGCLFANSNDTLIQKQIFHKAKTEIEKMLNGQSPLDFEKAIFITENAYWNNAVDYDEYKNLLDFHSFNIQNLAELNRTVKKQDFTATFLETEEEKRIKFNDLLYNWAIYTYFSDTLHLTYIIDNNKETFQHNPFQYPNNDPFAKLDWEKSQVINLLANSVGNCNAQVNLYKIFANRFNTDAKICTAPSHIFIVHNDLKDRQYNIELGTNSFPGSGSIMTLTYTPTDAVRSGIAMRELNQKQSIALNLVYLAKAYEDKFNTKTDKFIYDCAITTLKYDPKNLNAMLLQAEYLEEKIINKNKSVKELQNDNDFAEYEKLMVLLYDNGYREMPLDMKNIIVSRLRNEEAGIIYKDHTPKGFTNPKLNDNRYITLSNGLFDELHAFKPIEQYSRTLLDAKNKKIKDFVKADTLYNNYPLDPVVFAWAVDPLASNAAGWSPYRAFFDNPIYYIDPNGLFESTHTDEAGNIIAVYDDGDDGVYKHKDEDLKDFDPEKMSLTTIGAEKMGETEHWDEFINPESGEAMTKTKIQFDKSYDPIIKKMNKQAQGLDLMDIASQSSPGGDFDIKVPYKNTGGLLNGKYVSSRSAGNYLAGYNAQGGTLFGVNISFTTFQKLAGGLHSEGSLSTSQKMGVVLFGNSYGDAPAYGEIMYQYRMSKAGWDKAKLDNK